MNGPLFPLISSIVVPIIVTLLTQAVTWGIKEKLIKHNLRVRLTKNLYLEGDSIALNRYGEDEEEFLLKVENLDSERQLIITNILDQGKSVSQQITKIPPGEERTISLGFDEEDCTYYSPKEPFNLKIVDNRQHSYQVDTKSPIETYFV